MNDPHHPDGYGHPPQQPWPPPQHGAPQQPWPQQHGVPQQPWPQQHGAQQQPWPQQHGASPYGAPQPGAPQQPWPQQHGGPQYGAPPYMPHAAPGFSPHAPAWYGGYAPPQYEFSAEENKVLDDLATWCGGLGLLKFIAAVLAFVGRNMIGGAIELAVALSLWGGRKSLRAVVQTSGNDVTHLMTAIDKLATVFQIRLVLALIGAVLVTLLVVLFVALAIAAPEALDEIFGGG